MPDNVQRKIIHIDMDAFFASVEQRDDPSLRGRPVAVGGSSLRGVVAAASYEARTFGVHSAMPSVTARRKCPDLIFVKSRFDVYRTVSNQIREIFLDATPLVEPLSLDEAYLDVTDCLVDGQTATALAKDIKARIFAETGLTASAGVSFNKFLAKTASGWQKPDGLTVIPPSAAEKFLSALPIGKFHGVGPVTERKMLGFGIKTGQDLLDRDLKFLENHFGKSGEYYYWIARGVDDRAVQPNRIRKSIGAERTFSEDVHDFENAWELIQPLADKIWDQCEKTGRSARTLTLKVKYADFEETGRSFTLSPFYQTRHDVTREARHLLKSFHPFVKNIRLLGLRLSTFTDLKEAASQYDMFGDN